MKEFLLVFRRDASPEGRLSPEQIQQMMKPWQEWMSNLAAQNKLVSAGSRLMPDGRVVKEGTTVLNGPYVEAKEAVGGYSIIRAASIDEAAELAKGCPLFKIGGTVEVREIIVME